MKEEYEIALWQYRFFDRHSGWTDWENVEPRYPHLGQTVEDRLQEFKHYITVGCKYELRPLFLKKS